MGLRSVERRGVRCDGVRSGLGQLCESFATRERNFFPFFSISMRRIVFRFLGTDSILSFSQIGNIMIGTWSFLWDFSAKKSM